MSHKTNNKNTDFFTYFRERYDLFRIENFKNVDASYNSEMSPRTIIQRIFPPTFNKYVNIFRVEYFKRN